MHQDDVIAHVATAHDVEANARDLLALLAEARWEVRRQYAAEAVRRMEVRRHGVAEVVQRLVGDDVTNLEFVDLVDELTVA